MVELKLKNSAIVEAQERKEQAKLDLDRVIYEEINKCAHVNQGECDYLSSNMTNAYPPLRVCLDCGLVESGWGCGYLILKDQPAHHLSRDDVSDLRTLHIHSEDKGPLVRREVTVQQLVAAKLGISESTEGAEHGSS